MELLFAMKDGRGFNAIGRNAKWWIVQEMDFAWMEVVYAKRISLALDVKREHVLGIAMEMVYVEMELVNVGLALWVKNATKDGFCMEM